MIRIRCHYDDCQFLSGLYCGAAQVEIDRKKFCLTYIPVNQAEQEIEEEVLEEEEEEVDSWEDLESEEEELDDDDYAEEY